MGGGGGFRAESGQINKGAGTVSTARGDMVALLGALRGEVAENAASWKGTGASEFQALMQRWDDSARLLTKSMEEFENNLRGTDKNYQQMDQAAQETMAKLRAQMELG